jgi:dihydrofolate reductase
MQKVVGSNPIIRSLSSLDRTADWLPFSPTRQMRDERRHPERSLPATRPTYDRRKREERRTMRELILFMHMSLDGYVAASDETTPVSSGDDGIFETVVPELMNSSDTLLLGRVVADQLLGYWLTAEANDPDLSPGALAHARWVASAHKVILSRADEQLPWSDSELAVARNDDDIVQAISALKEQPGKNIVVYGGVRTAQQLARLNLIDEYQFIVHPVALGDGGALFADLPDRLELTLVETVELKAGAVFLRYRS